MSFQSGKEGRGGGHRLPSWQEQKSCRDFIYWWLGNKPATVCGSQVQCIWQSWSFELLCIDNTTLKKKTPTKTNIRFDLLQFWTKQAYYQGGFWLSSLFHVTCASLVNVLQIPVIFVEQKQKLQQTNPKEKDWVLVCWLFCWVFFF